MDNFKLITRPGCPHCEKVQEFLAKEKPGLKVEVEEQQMKIVDSPYAAYGNTAPILVGRDFFLHGSETIIDFLKTLE